MYGKTAAALSLGASGVGANSTGPNSLPFTGLEIGWLIIAGFTLLALGLAVARLIPRTEE
jgi:hypothetical protein